MRFVDLVYNVLDRVAPMSDMDKSDLRRDANIEYSKLKEQVKNPDGTVKKASEVKDWKLKLVCYAEHWTVRTCFAALYVWIVPAIQRYMEGGNEEDDDEQQ